MVSNPGWGGLLGSVERLLEFCWWDVCAVAVESLLVEPVDPAEGGKFELVDVVPPAGVRPVDTLGLVEPVGCLSERVVVGISDRADRWFRSDLIETLGETH